MTGGYNVLIVGAGQIGATFDNPSFTDVLTHAHAFSSISEFNLIGFVDAALHRSKEAAGVWGGQAFESLSQAFNRYQIDVVVVAVPDEYHYEVLMELNSLPVKAILAEKPLVKTERQAREIMLVYQEKKIGIGVNYSRRYVPEFEKIKHDIENGKYGKYLTGHGYYGKGILHNGSHSVDFIRYILGEVKEVRAVDKIYDYYEDDPSVSAIIEVDRQGFFYLQHADCRAFTIFEMEFLFEGGRLRFIDAGHRVEIYEVSPSKLYSGYYNLQKTSEIRTSLNKALKNAALGILEYLEAGKVPACTLHDGCKVLEICSKLAGNLE